MRFAVALSLVAGGIAGTLALKSVTAGPDVVPIPAVAEPLERSDYIAVDELDNFATYPGGSQLTFVRLSDGEHLGSATERFPRPALSLVKLYLADYVLTYGDAEDRELALEMIKGSDDKAADKLSEKYPRAIETTARRYGLWSTFAGDSWGVSRTSTYDSVKFLRSKLENDADSELLAAMKESHEVASDGYKQNFGTAQLPGVQGTKWGWSNDRQLHSSISFGEDYIVAAAVMGSAEDLTKLVERQIAPYLAGETAGGADDLKGGV